jgi:hypothetical protein
LALVEMVALAAMLLTMLGLQTEQQEVLVAPQYQF